MEHIRKGRPQKVKKQAKQEYGCQGGQGSSVQGIPHVSSREPRELERTPEEVARTLLAACEGTISSLAAQLALMVSADFVPNENIGRTKIANGNAIVRNLIARRLQHSTGGRERSSTGGRERSSAGA